MALSLRFFSIVTEAVRANYRSKATSPTALLATSRFMLQMGVQIVQNKQ